MKRFLLPFYIAAGIMMIALPSCGGGTDPEPPAEENLVITASPALNGQQETPAPGPNFPLSVTVTSKMPPKGVTVEVVAKEESSSSGFYTDTKTTSSSVSNFAITNTPATVSCRVTVTVTSLSKPANKATGFYFYSKK